MPLGRPAGAVVTADRVERRDPQPEPLHLPARSRLAVRLGVERNVRAGDTRRRVMPDVVGTPRLSHRPVNCRIRSAATYSLALAVARVSAFAADDALACW